MNEFSGCLPLASFLQQGHYKNSPNDLLLMADAPAHHLLVLLETRSWEYLGIAKCLEDQQACEAPATQDEFQDE